MTPPKLLISEFSTLNFRTDWRLEFQYPTRYVQRLLRTDVIDTQYVVSGDFQGALRIVLFDGSGSVLAHATGTELGPIDSGTAYRADWPEGTFPLPCGCYTMAFGLQPYNLILASAPFRVVDELPDSVLFEVANDEDEFGTVFSGQQFRFRAVWKVMLCTWPITIGSFLHLLANGLCRRSRNSLKNNTVLPKPSNLTPLETTFWPTSRLCVFTVS